MSTVTFDLEIPGATEVQLQAGYEAAAAYFREKGVHPVDAWNVYTDDTADWAVGLTADDIEREVRLAETWVEAERRAYAAILGEGISPPPGAHFGVVAPEKDGDEVD